MLDEPPALHRFLTLLPPALLPLVNRGPGRPPLDDTPDVALRFPRRAEMLRRIQEEPGILISELRLAMDIGGGSFYLHFKKLQAAGLIELQESDPKRRRVYPAGQAPPPGRGDDPLFSDVTRKIAKAVLERPGSSSAEIVAETGYSERAVQIHLKRLMEARLVEATTQGRRIMYVPARGLDAAWRGTDLPPR